MFCAIAKEKRESKIGNFWKYLSKKERNMSIKVANAYIIGIGTRILCGKGVYCYCKTEKGETK